MTFKSESPSESKNEVTTASSEKSMDDSICNLRRSISDQSRRTGSSDTRLSSRSHHKSRRGLQSKLHSIKNKQTQQNICILDWDDTLFCTTSFLPKNRSDVLRLKSEHHQILEKLDEAASRVLIKSLAQENS
jgi:hypothetical protein